MSVGPYEEVAAACPAARVRRWPGMLTPGLRNGYGPELLERAYHPDPREADALGTEPIIGDALAALAMDPARWGASARRGLQRMLSHGTTAVAGTYELRAVREAVERSGLVLEERQSLPEGTPSLNPFASGLPVGEVFGQPLYEGADASFAVFDVPVEGDEGDLHRALAQHGSRTCVATVLGGRLVHRRR